MKVPRLLHESQTGRKPGEKRKERKACDSENPLEIFCDMLKLCAFSALAQFQLMIRTKNKELSEKYFSNKATNQTNEIKI